MRKELTNLFERSPKSILKKRRERSLFLLIAFVLCSLLLIAVRKKDGDLPTKDQVITIQTARVARRCLTNIVVASGLIQPIIQVNISPEVSGEIVELPVKEGQRVKKGDLLVKINPDVYIAAVNQAKANYKSSQSAETYAAVNLKRVDADFQRNLALFNAKLLSQSDFRDSKYARDMAKAQLDSANSQVKMAKATMESAEEKLAKTTILSPLNGTITRLNSQVGEGVLGTVQNVGTEIMTISDLSEMEARVDVDEMHVVKIAPGEKASLIVRAFGDHKFNGVVTDVADSSESGNQSEQSERGAIRFQVRIRFKEKEAFRSGMSVKAAIETDYRTNVLTVPVTSVITNSILVAKTSVQAKGVTNGTTSPTLPTNYASDIKNSAALSKNGAPSIPVGVIFVVEGDHAKAVSVELGIRDKNYWEIIGGLTNNEEIVSGRRITFANLQTSSEIPVGLATSAKHRK